MSTVLVTGGAGYIGSHAVRALRAAAHTVVVFDNLSAGHAAAVGDATLVEGDVRRAGNPVRDYLLDEGDRWSTTARLVGAASLSASSSASDADSLGSIRRGSSPWAALDGAEESAWRSGPGRAGTAWWRLDLETPVDPSTVRLVGGPDAADDQEVQVRTGAGTSDPVEVGPGESRTVPVCRQTRKRLRCEKNSRALSVNCSDRKSVV